MATKISTQNDNKVVVCYNCQTSFFKPLGENKALYFCATCWSKTSKGAK